MAEALYRKYRPQIFEDIVGQEHIERTIKNAIDQDKVSHAYLFTGPRGTGKTTTARLLAKALLCEHGPTPDPDGTCANCLAVANGTHPDVYELDAASRTGVENVREEIIGRVQFAPTQGRYKVYIIDEVHMLSTAAFNALLKTLEEPPDHVVFILCTTDSQKVPETIHSRCQRFDFHRISIEAIVSRLGAICVSEGVEFEGEALDLIAHRAEGGMRNALTSLEQLITFSEGKVTLEVAERLLGSLDTDEIAEIVAAIGKRDAASCFTWTAQYMETGADIAQFVRDLAEHMRNLYVLLLSGSEEVLEVNDAIRQELHRETSYFSPDRLMRILGILGDLSAELRTSINPRLSFEIALTRMVRPDSDITLEALAERIEALESGYSATVQQSFAAAPLAQEPVLASQDMSAPLVEGVSFSEAPLRQDGGDVVQEQAAPMQVSTQSPAQVPAQTDFSVPPLAVEESSERSASPEVSTLSSAVPLQGPEAKSDGASVVSPEAEGLRNPAALQRVWQKALQIIKKEKAAYGVLFLNTRTRFDEEQQSVLIEFPKENSFAYMAVQKAEVREIVEKALKDAAGFALSFTYVQNSAQAAQPSQAAQVQPARVQPAQSQPVTPVQSSQSMGVQPVQAAEVSSFSGSSASASPSPGAQSPQGEEGLLANSEEIPLDAYEGFVQDEGDALGDDDSLGSSLSQKAVSPASSAAADTLDEEALKSLLIEAYGEEVKFDSIENEEE